MSNRRPHLEKQRAITADKPRAAEDRVTAQAPARPVSLANAEPPWRLPLGIGGALVVLLVALGGLFLWLDYAEDAQRVRPMSTAKPGPQGRQVAPGEIDWEEVARKLPERKKWAPPAWAPKSAEDKVIDRFVRLRNARDPAALALLGRAPAVPAEPVSEDEAKRLQADFFLRDDLEVEHVCRGEADGEGNLKATAGLYTLVAKGYGNAPPMPLRTAAGIDTTGQRVIYNPDVMVEVRDGKVFGVRAALSVWP